MEAEYDFSQGKRGAINPTQHHLEKLALQSG